MPEGAKEGCWRWLVAGAPEGANLCQDPEVVKVRRKVVVEGDYLGVVKVPKMGGEDLCPDPGVVKVPRMVALEGGPCLVSI